MHRRERERLRVSSHSRYEHLRSPWLLQPPTRRRPSAANAYWQYEAWVETQPNCCIKILNSDQGGEHLGKEFTLYLKPRNTEQRLNVHNTPQHVGVAVADRCNQTIAERIHALLHASSAPKYLWDKATRHAVWLMNHTATKAVKGMTPYEAAFGKRPDLKNVWE